ncbi:hypothetical protein [Methylobacterium sp. JK268]
MNATEYKHGSNPDKNVPIFLGISTIGLLETYLLNIQNSKFQIFSYIITAGLAVFMALTLNTWFWILFFFALAFAIGSITKHFALLTRAQEAVVYSRRISASIANSAESADADKGSSLALQYRNIFATLHHLLFKIDNETLRFKAIKDRILKTNQKGQ